MLSHILYSIFSFTIATDVKLLEKRRYSETLDKYTRRHSLQLWTDDMEFIKRNLDCANFIKKPYLTQPHKAKFHKQNLIIFCHTFYFLPCPSMPLC